MDEKRRKIAPEIIKQNIERDQRALRRSLERNVMQVEQGAQETAAQQTAAQETAAQQTAQQQGRPTEQQEAQEQTEEMMALETALETLNLDDTAAPLQDGDGNLFNVPIEDTLNVFENQETVNSNHFLRRIIGSLVPLLRERVMNAQQIITLVQMYPQLLRNIYIWYFERYISYWQNQAAQNAQQLVDNAVLIVSILTSSIASNIPVALQGRLQDATRQLQVQTREVGSFVSTAADLMSYLSNRTYSFVYGTVRNAATQTAETAIVRATELINSAAYGILTMQQLINYFRGNNMGQGGSKRRKSRKSKKSKKARKSKRRRTHRRK